MPKKALLFAVAFMLYMNMNFVYAVSIGVSPGRVRFDNLLQGGYAERTVTIGHITDHSLTGVKALLVRLVNFPKKIAFQTAE